MKTYRDRVITTVIWWCVFIGGTAFWVLLGFLLARIL